MSRPATVARMGPPSQPLLPTVRASQSALTANA